MSPARHEADSPEVAARIDEALAMIPGVLRQLSSYFGRLARVEDLRSYASEAAMIAARSFDPDRGTPFRYFASTRIRFGVVNGMRREGEIPARLHKKLREVESSLRTKEAMDEENAAAPPRTPEDADSRLSDHLAALATALATGSLFLHGDEVMEELVDPGDPVDDAYAREELAAVVREVVATRPETERLLIERHWFDGMTLEDAAKSVGLSPSWGCRVHARAIEGITRALQRRNVARDL
jgi:RNA polymerase sigma factor for flagellar operon FliA